MDRWSLGRRRGHRIVVASSASSASAGWAASGVQYSRRQEDHRGPDSWSDPHHDRDVPLRHGRRCRMGRVADLGCRSRDDPRNRFASHRAVSIPVARSRRTARVGNARIRRGPSAIDISPLLRTSDWPDTRRQSPPTRPDAVWVCTGGRGERLVRHHEWFLELIKNLSGAQEHPTRLPPHLPAATKADQKCPPSASCEHKSAAPRERIEIGIGPPHPLPGISH